MCACVCVVSRLKFPGLNSFREDENITFFSLHVALYHNQLCLLVSLVCKQHFVDLLTPDKKKNPVGGAAEIKLFSVTTKTLSSSFFGGFKHPQTDGVNKREAVNENVCPTIVYQVYMAYSLFYIYNVYFYST